MASSGLLNVDPEKQADPFYRYKMPRIMTKVEGNGNGIKTVISNIEQICERIYRKAEYPMKYFGHDLAVTSKFKDDKWILTGSFSQEKVQSSLFDFIKKFVLCKACRNPETVIVVDDRGDVFLSCKACSRVTPVDPKEKLTNLLSKSEKASKTESGKPSDKKKKKDKSKDEKEEEKYDSQTRQVTESDTITISECPKADLPNPIEVLKEFIRSEPPPKESEIAGKVFDMRGDYGLDDKGVVCLVFESLYDSDIVKQIPKNYKIMKRFIKPETEKDLIVNCMTLCAEEAALKPKFPIVLKTFYDLNVLSEEAILSWHNGKNTKSLDKSVQLYFKEKSQPLIDWLKEADDDEEEEEEEEEDNKPKPVQAQANGTKVSAKQEEEEDDDVDIDAI